MTLVLPVSSTLLSQHIAWLGLHLHVPADWQVVRHSTSPDKGSLVLVDRRRQRLQVLWTQLERRPDITHMISDHRARELEQDRSATFRPLETAQGWQGVQREVAEQTLITRAVRFDDASNRLVEVVLVTDPTEPDEATLVEDLLAAVAVHPDPAKDTFWAMFDLAVTTPQHWRLERARVRAADATFHYVRHDDRERPTRCEAMIRRRGMADVWYRDNAARMLEREHPKLRLDFSETTYDGVPATAAIGREAGKRYERFLGKLRVRQDVVWAWPPANAVYQITTLSPARSPTDPLDFRVHFRDGSSPEAELLPDRST